MTLYPHYESDCPHCEDAGYETPATIEWEIEPATPGRTYGPPERCYPPEGGFCEPVNCVERVEERKWVTGWLCPQCGGVLTEADCERAYNEWDEMERGRAEAAAEDAYEARREAMEDR